MTRTGLPGVWLAVVIAASFTLGAIAAGTWEHEYRGPFDPISALPWLREPPTRTIP